MPRQHGAAGDKDGGDVDSCRRHQQTGHVFIAVGDHHQCVKLMGNGHSLGGIADQITGDQRILHADMPHGNTVADRNGRELNRRTACHPDASLYGLSDLVPIHMTGNDLIIGADHAYQRAVRLLLGITQRRKQRPIGRTIHALGNVGGKFHRISSSYNKFQSEKRGGRTLPPPRMSVCCGSIQRRTHIKIQLHTTDTQSMVLSLQASRICGEVRAEKIPQAPQPHLIWSSEN